MAISSTSPRNSLLLLFRRHSHEALFLLLLVQFIVWASFSMHKPTAYLGRRYLRSYNNETSMDQGDWLKQEVERVMQQEGYLNDSWLSGVQENDVETESEFRRRRERAADAGIFNVSATVPGVDDVYARLKDYLIEMQTKHFYTDLEYVKTLQKHPTADELDASALDHLADLDSIPNRIEFLNSLLDKVKDNVLRVAIFTTSSVDVTGVRSELLPWMQYHTELGISHFYILYDGSDVAAVNYLMKIKHVTLIHIHPPFATETDLVDFATWTHGHRQWGGKPGNFELMVKQGFGASKSLELAKQKGDNWLLHIDPDELFYPDNSGFSLVQEFLRQPDYVSSVRFMNFEGQPEFGDVINRYEQVTLFRCHKYFITAEANFLRNRCKLGNNRTFLVLYANGKSAVRVDAPGVRQLGPHFFTGDSSDRWKTQSNPEGLWRDTISNSSFILHYGYSYLSDVSSKAKRSCPGDEFEQAVVGDPQQLGNCFLIDFDRDAYIAAITGEEKDFFYSRQVLSEGVRIKCMQRRNPGWCIVYDIEYFKYLLTKSGLLRRAREPQQILRMHERIIQIKEQQQNELNNLEMSYEIDMKETNVQANL